MSEAQFEPSIARVERIDWRLGESLLTAIRRKVFIEEQGIHESIELDGQDPQAHHYVAMIGSKPVGTARQLADGRIGRLAVLASHRRCGIGTALMRSVIADAQRLGVATVYLHAQTDSLEFYQTLGFAPVGEPFTEADKPHQAMQMPIDYQSYFQRIVSAHYPKPARQLALNLCQKAQRSVRIFSESLDPVIFDSPEMALCLSELSRSGSRTSVQILITDSHSLRARGHRLLELAKRLPSFVQIKVTDAPEQLTGRLVLLADQNNTLYMPDTADHRVRYEIDDRPLNRRLTEIFERVWQRSEEDANFRDLGI